MLCDLCDSLNISALVEDYVREAEGETGVWYSHHASIQDLVKSADSGCEFCRFIITCAKLERPQHWGPGAGDSLFDSCLQMEETDIKIWVGPPLGDIDTLIWLSVKFGPFQPDDYDYDQPPFNHTMRYPDPMRLRINVPQRQKLLIGQRNIPVGSYEVDLDMASDLNFDIILAWINECFDTHKSCPRHEAVVLPTRLVCIGKDYLDWADLRLVEPPAGAKGEYLALSHCWGGPITPILTKKNHSALLQHISFSDLPKNFQDALFITLRLGGNLLWIDSLCIIQDSPEDWAYEATRMAEVYLHATLTICAGTSEGSTAGIFNQFSNFPATEEDRSASATAQIQEHTFEMRVYPKWSEDDTTVKIIPPPCNKLYRRLGVASLERFLDVERYGALSQRAWCLQEKVLSPRRLVYGDHRIYWQCTAWIDCTDGLAEGFSPGPPFSNMLLLSYLNSPDPGWRFESGDEARNARRRHLLTQGYYDLVCEYSNRQLTCERDVLPAFSGIASKFHPIFGGTYLAGIWSTDIISGLCWYHNDTYNDFKPKEYRAPSWAWTSVKTEVYFSLVGENGNDKRCTCPGALELELLSYEMRPADPSNAYGLVVGGELVVQGHTRRLLRIPRRLWTGPGKNGPDSCHVVWDEDELENDNVLIATVNGEEVLVVIFDPELSRRFGQRWDCPDNTDEFLIVFATGVGDCGHTCQKKASTGQAGVAGSVAERAPSPISLEAVMSSVGWMWAEAQEQGGAMEEEPEDPKVQEGGAEKPGMGDPEDQEQGDVEGLEAVGESEIAGGGVDGPVADERDRVLYLGVILRPVANRGANVYERAGFASMALEGFSWDYIRSWETQVLTIV